LRRVLFILVLTAAVFTAFAACAAQSERVFTGKINPTDNGEKLLAMLVSLTDPESLEIMMDQIPDDAGSVRDISIFIRGASIGGFRVEKFAIESSFLEMNPPSNWIIGERDSLSVKNALRSNVELVALERDINAALVNYAGGDWSRISVDLKPGRVDAKGHYSSGGLSIFAEVTTRLEIRQGKQIWLKDTSIKINNDDQTDVIRKELAKIQPVVDIGRFPFPVTLAVLDIDENRVVFSTRTLPKPVKGLTYRYTRGS